MTIEPEWNHGLIVDLVAAGAIESARERAVETYSGDVTSKIADFVKGAFAALNNAANMVKNAAGSAIHAIGGVFGGLFDVTLESAMSLSMMSVKGLRRPLPPRRHILD